jgi:hypothetical protein
MLGDPLRVLLVEVTLDVGEAPAAVLHRTDAVDVLAPRVVWRADALAAPAPHHKQIDSGVEGGHFSASDVSSKSL